MSHLQFIIVLAGICTAAWIYPQLGNLMLFALVVRILWSYST